MAFCSFHFSTDDGLNEFLMAFRALHELTPVFGPDNIEYQKTQKKTPLRYVQGFVLFYEKSFWAYHL